MILGVPMNVWLIASVPLLLAVAIWTICRPDQLALYVLLAATGFSTTVASVAGTNISPSDLILLAVVSGWIVAASVGKMPAPWLRSNYLLAPCGLLVALNFVSALWSSKPQETFVHVVQMTELAIVFPVVFASLPSSLASTKRALLVFVAATTVMAVVVIAAYAPSALSGDLQAQPLPTLNKNALGGFLACGLVVAVVLLMTDVARARVFALPSLLLTVGLVSTVSRGSLIGALVAIIGASFILQRGRLLTLAGVAVLVGTFLAIYGTDSRLVEETSLQEGSIDSVEVRGQVWDSALEQIGREPIFGTGGGTYLDFIPKINQAADDPHNIVLLTAWELGAVGLAVLAFLLFRFGRTWFGSRDLPGEARAIGAATGAAAASVFVHSLFDVAWVRGTFAIGFAMIGLLLATLRLAGHVPAQHTATTALITPRPVAPTPKILR